MLWFSLQSRLGVTWECTLVKVGVIWQRLLLSKSHLKHAAKCILPPLQKAPYPTFCTLPHRKKPEDERRGGQEEGGLSSGPSDCIAFLEKGGWCCGAGVLGCWGAPICKESSQCLMTSHPPGGTTKLQSGNSTPQSSLLGEQIRSELNHCWVNWIWKVKNACNYSAFHLTERYLIIVF